MASIGKIKHPLTIRFFKSQKEDKNRKNIVILDVIIFKNFVLSIIKIIIRKNRAGNNPVGLICTKNNIRKIKKWISINS